MTSVARRWWEYRKADVLAVLYLCFMVQTGIAGLVVRPTPAIGTLGAVAYIYSLGIALASVVAIFSVLKALKYSELVSFIALALFSLSHAILTFATTGPEGDQAAWRIVAASVGVMALTVTRWERGIPVKVIEEHMRSTASGDD